MAIELSPENQQNYDFNSPYLRENDPFASQEIVKVNIESPDVQMDDGEEESRNNNLNDLKIFDSPAKNKFLSNS